MLEQAFYIQVCDFSPTKDINYSNRLFQQLGRVGNLVEQLGLTLLISVDEYEVQALNHGLPRQVACHLP
ncbi:hypothetical protein SAMN04487998_3410 [Hymenobacter actinosclerus]|uniref:Uncharacterized protein n=1 Tax=Hymenobacter actinosclerus TaxID=82805 RepID=A0A1I0INM5_9BACT|nr:hypothetical protein SAMN04487998_3410 [Hymenobacter actinosclerus]